MSKNPTQLSRKLRRDQTPAERIVWSKLRGRQINGRKWRRQQPIDQYVVDFLCPELKLIVEIDGDVHAFQETRDEKRQAYLETQGFRVVRFTNNDIIKNLDGVLAVIWELCQ